MFFKSTDGEYHMGFWLLWVDWLCMMEMSFVGRKFGQYWDLHMRNQVQILIASFDDRLCLGHLRVANVVQNRQLVHLNIIMSI